MSAIFAKDPDEILDYGFDWVLWLGTDTVVTSTWVVPTGLTLSSSSHDATSTTVWLSAGTAGIRYTVVNRVVTAVGRTAERVFHVDVRSNEAT